MNRQKLDALLAAGIITLQQHQAALQSINAAGIITDLPQLELQIPAAIRLDVTDDPESEWDGILRGTVTGYGVLIPSHGMILEPGCLTARQPLSANKMMRDHDHSQPVGYMLDVDDAGVDASFQIAPSERARVLQEVTDKLRDGLSVGFTALEYDIDDDWTFHVIAADWYETSLCAVPAVVGAGVTSVAAALATLRKENRTMNRAQLAAALAAGTITQEQHDTALAALDAIELTAPPASANVPLEVQAGPQLQLQQPAPVVTEERQLSLDQVVRRMSEAARTGSVGGFQLAISDILPADDVGDAFTRPEWLAQVFTATDETRTWVNAIGTPELMTALDGKGWRWDDEPEVDEYDMDNTEVPSNDISTEAVTYSGWGVAAGWGVARSLLDFAEEEFTRAFWERVAASYQKKTNVGTRTRVLAACRAPGAIVAGSGGTASVATGNAVALIKQLIRDVRAIDGGKANRVFLGATQFGLLEDLSTEDLPLWLKSAEVRLDIADATANVGQLIITHDAALAANQGVAFDSRAFRVKEKKIPNLSAIAISHGKVDLGLYGYMRLDTHDPRLAVKRTAGEVLPT